MIHGGTFPTEAPFSVITLAKLTKQNRPVHGLIWNQPLQHIDEGANMPTTMDATDYLMENGVVFMPGKAANAGGVATSGLEMSQNSERLSWTFEEVDEKLHGIMKNIYHAADDAAKEYGVEGNYVMGANIAARGVDGRK